MWSFKHSWGSDDGKIINMNLKYKIFLIVIGVCPLILLTTISLHSTLIPNLMTWVLSGFLFFTVNYIAYFSRRLWRWYFSSRTIIWIQIYKDAHWHFDYLLSIIKIVSFLNMIAYGNRSVRNLNLFIHQY